MEISCYMCCDLNQDKDFSADVFLLFKYHVKKLLKSEIT